jgi:RNA polymerase sigma factor (sigma-70 family)
MATETPRAVGDFEALLARARKGSSEALGCLFELCRPYLLAVAVWRARRLLRLTSSYSDLVQEAFVNASRGFDGFRGTAEVELLAWLRRILCNVITQAAWARDRLPPQGDLDPEDDPVAPGPQPHEQAIAREEAERLRRALGQLPELYQQVIHWQVWDRLPFEEIGRRLSPPRSAEAARSLWKRAVEVLRKHYRE